MSNPRKPDITQAVDDLEEPVEDIQALDFSERRDEAHERSGDKRSRAALREAYGMSDDESLGDGEQEDDVSLDDISPQPRHATGVAHKPSKGPMDKELSVVDAAEIGGGSGLDEAELSRVDPLDGKPWDGQADSLEEDLSIGMSEIELRGDALLNPPLERSRRPHKPADKA